MIEEESKNNKKRQLDLSSLEIEGFTVLGIDNFASKNKVSICLNFSYFIKQEVLLR